MATVTSGARVHGTRPRGSLTRFRRRNLSMWARVLGWLLTLGAVWLGWEAVYRATAGGNLLFASPEQTFKQLGKLAVDGTLLGDMSVTVQEFLIGGVGAAVVGISVGVVIGYVRPIKTLAQPWLSAGYATPLIALTPLFIVWFGVGMWSKVAIGFLVMVFPTIMNTALGVSETNRGLLEMMQSLGASERQIIPKVILRGAVPHITTGLQLGVGKGFTAVVAAELMGSNAGMGYRILSASQTFDIGTLLAYVVVLAVIGVVILGALDALNFRVNRHSSAR